MNITTSTTLPCMEARLKSDKCLSHTCICSDNGIWDPEKWHSTLSGKRSRGPSPLTLQEGGRDRKKFQGLNSLFFCNMFNFMFYLLLSVEKLSSEH